MRLQLWERAQVRRAARDPILRQTDRQISQSHSALHHRILNCKVSHYPSSWQEVAVAEFRAAHQEAASLGTIWRALAPAELLKGSARARWPHQLPWHRLQHCHLLWESSIGSIVKVPLSKGMQFPGYSVSRDTETHAFPLHSPANSNSLLEGGCHKKQETHCSICTTQLLDCWVLKKKKKKKTKSKSIPNPYLKQHGDL